ncbi:AdoMet-dependent rRNA methyltransferase spb1 [Trichinella pseudospiralis]|uniref:Putative rRNA methyltransferase n=1 Tax=Trichinella pseudospiralis TaxID=6337 RepID=A0A0V1EYP7_TRIPS|nr:AdoMet-dependent rRNA methyltransferase spb1 [Trichinella pseudospiralis]
MGKKKVGKQRRDKYYNLAKQAGYRSRAAFKLIHLNKKFQFLEKSTCLVDLCAAPGGWLQVASQYMPVSRLIIGVDLVSIKALHNVITLQNDITTESCLSQIKRELKTWTADCVLHDGSPNVGKNWNHDAFQQAQLTLHALRVASAILRPGGWFVTKLFRSKDHPTLVNAMKKLFNKVHVTKPQASRQESAEIYAVCQGFKPADSTVSLSFKSVFKELDLEPQKTKINLFRPEKQKRKAEGYAEGCRTLYNRVSAGEFITSSDYLEILGGANQLLLDDPKIASHPATSDEIKQLCEDVKVLGRRELRQLISWRRKLRSDFKAQSESLKRQLDANVENNEMDSEAEEEEKINAELEEAMKNEARVSKKKRKKEFKEKRRQKKKLEYNMVIQDDVADIQQDRSLFSIQNAIEKASKPQYSDSEESLCVDEEETLEGKDDILSILPVANEVNDDPKAKVKRWFTNDIFNNIESEEEDEELDRITSTILEKDENNDEGGENCLQPVENTVEDFSAKQSDEINWSDLSEEEKEIETENELKNSQKKKKSLDPEGLALAQMWIHSTKTRRNLIDAGFNRFVNNDSNLPDWFAEDEKKHYHPNLPITKEAVEEFKRRQREINARPIKKVAEAKARKRRKALKRMEKAKKKVEGILENDGLTEVEKRKELKRIYKQSKQAPKKEVTYVVAKKGLVGKRIRRPQGVTGRYKMVDPRMKKDFRRLKNNSKRRKRR